MKRLALTLLLVALTTTAAVQTPTSRATDVRDGDTIELRMSTSKALTVRRHAWIGLKPYAWPVSRNSDARTRFFFSF